MPMQRTGASWPALLGAEICCGPPWLTSIVSAPLFELLVELNVLADVDVSELLCPNPPADVGVTGEWSTGDVGEFGSCSFVRFFLRNPRVGIRAPVRGMRRKIDRGLAQWRLPEINQ